MIERLIRFGTVGIAGFVVDAGTLVVLVSKLGVAPMPARVVSFLTAATVTFVLNQRFTFKFLERFNFYRWISYLAITAIGACVNVGIYRIWIAANGTLAAQLVIGTALGSLAAMSINYFVSSTFVFRSSKWIGLSSNRSQ